MENCGKDAAQQAAEALDNNNAGDTRTLIRACMDEVRENWVVNVRKERNFIEMIDDFEITGKGKDMSIRYDTMSNGLIAMKDYEIQ